MVQLKTDNPSFVLHGIKDVRFEERPVPDVVDDQVLVQIAKTGICGSDIHYMLHARIGTFVLDEPMCLGHESSGNIAKLGPAAEARGWKVGDRVALEPGMTCRTCDLCKKGAYELCPNITFAATPPYVYGTLCRYYKLPADMIYPLPESVTMEDGAMMEPLSVAVHSVSTIGGCRTQQNVIVFGAGPVGLLCMAVAKALGARRVIAVDINEERLAFAKGYAATDTFMPPNKDSTEEADVYCQRMAKKLQTDLKIPELGHGSIDLCVEASGAPTCVQIGISVLRPAGTYVQVGLGARTTLPVPLFHVITRELKFLGSWRYGPGDYPLAISLVERGLVNLKPLVTQRYAFTDALEAFETMRNGRDSEGNSAIKCIIDAPR